MTTNPTRSKKRSRFWRRALVLASLGIVGGVAVRPLAKRKYHEWSAHSHAAKAAEFLAQGDTRHAILSARSALEHMPQDAGATRIVVKALESIGAPEAEQWRLKLESLLPGDAENTLSRAQAALKNGDVESAELLANSLSPANRENATYHTVSAAIAYGKKDAPAAESHWAEAVRLEPDENRHKLNLAAVQLDSRKPESRMQALAKLQELRGKPASSVEALRLLLADSLRSRDAAKSRDFADALVADARSIFNDKLARLSALRSIHDARSGPYLLELRDATISEPGDFFTLLTWMNGKDSALMVIEWVRWMPPEIVSVPPVSVAVADAFAKSKDWQRLQEFTETAKWGELDYLRRAFLASALERLDEEAESAKEWGHALAAANGRVDAQERLARFAIRSKWNSRAEEIMWPLSATPQCPRWVLNSLWEIACKREETAHLQRLSAILVKVDPAGIASRNNYAFLSLLTRNKEGNPHQLAENLYREYPNNAMVASTYGLSLYQQGKAKEAVTLMAKLKLEDLRQPQVALYYAIFLTAIRKTSEAEEFLRCSKDWPMFPEEKALLDRVKFVTSKEGAEKDISIIPKSTHGESK